MKWTILILFFLMHISAFTQDVPKSDSTFHSSTSLIKSPILNLPSFDLLPNKEKSIPSLMLKSNYQTPFVEYNTTVFCKFEHKLMMSTRLPLKMRIGDVQYVDKLEGKN